MKLKKQNESYILKIYWSVMNRRKKKTNINRYTCDWSWNFKEWKTIVEKLALNEMHRFWYECNNNVLDDKNEYKKFIERHRDQSSILMNYEKKSIAKSEK